MTGSPILQPNDPTYGNSERSCEICKNPLNQNQVERHLRWHDVGDCLKCYICNEECSTYHIERSLMAERKISHDYCWEKAMAEEIANRPAEITQGQLNYLNLVRLEFMTLCFPNNELDESQNMDASFIQAGKLVKDLSLEQKFLFMRKLEAAAAAVSIIISSEKRRKEVHVGPPPTSKKKKVEAETPDAEPVEKKKRGPKSADEKAIEQLMKFAGFTREEAEAQIRGIKGESNGVTTAGNAGTA